MSLSFGTAANVRAQLAGPFGSIGSAVKLTEFQAPASQWKGAISPFSQVVAIPGVSALSKVDLQLDPSQLELLRDHEAAFSVINDAGVTTLYAIGEKPLADLTFQATLTEVTA